jgi:hypothetical protein
MTTRPDPADRLAAVHAQLIDAVEALATGEEWQRMLTIAARFPTYSTGNVLLIGVQRPDATKVAGIRTWNSLGRRVRKGEKGIAILAPCLYRPRSELDTVAPPRRRDTRRPGDADRKAVSAATTAGSDGLTVPTQRELRGFRVAFVFDVQQTEGEPLAEVAPAELKLAAPEHLVDRLRDLRRADGYTVRDGPCGTAYGYTDFATRTVQIREGVAGGQGAKTLAHDLLTAPTAPPGGDLRGVPRRHAAGCPPPAGSWSTAAAVAPLTNAEEVSRGIARSAGWRSSWPCPGSRSPTRRASRWR